MRRPPGGVRSRRGAQIPRMHWQGRGASSAAQRNRESVFPSARRHSAGSGECGAECAMRGRAACVRGRRRGAFANPAGVAPDIPGALVASAGGGGFGAANDIAAVRRSERVIFSAINYYRKISGRDAPSACRRPAGSGGGLSPRTFAARPGAIFARFAGSGFAAVRVRPARAAESGVGARRKFPECPGKGRGKTIAPSATGKAFFRPPVRIRRVRANARTRWPRPRSAAGSGRGMTSPRFAARAQA